MDTSISVVIAAVPERHDNLELLLDDLSDQTTRIDTVHVLLNGWDADAATAMQQLHQRRGRMFDLSLDLSTDRRPAGYRWRVADMIRWSLVDTLAPHSGVVAVLDDDLRVHPDYLKRTAAAFDAPETAMVSWTGHTLEKKRPYYGFVPRPAAVPLWIAGAGTSMVRVSALNGLLEHPHAGELLASGGDDEALVSLHLWQQGYRLLRPSGALPVRSVDALQESPTASHKLHGPRWEFRRAQLRKQYTWGDV